MSNKVIGLTMVGLILISIFTALQQWSEEWTTTAMGKSQTVTFRPQQNSPPLKTSNQDEWEAEYINEIDTTFSTLGGSLRLNIKQLWIRDTCLRDSVTSRWYLNNDDTLFFRNLTHVKVFKNDSIVYNQKLGFDLFNEHISEDWQQLYRFGQLSSVIFNNKYGQVYINQVLEIPYSDEKQNAYIALNEAGALIGKGVNNACDGGWELSDNEEYLLTCSEIIAVANFKTRKLDDRIVRHTSMINDSVFTVVYDPTHLSDELANAYLLTVKGDTLFSFLYTDLTINFQKQLPIGKLEGGNFTVFYDASLGEVISFNAQNWFNPEYYTLDDLVNYEYPPSDGFSVKIPDSGMTFYFNAQLKITGFASDKSIL